MRRRIGFLRYFAQSRFAEALSQLRTDGWPHSSRELLACYRLGLYSTVAKASWDGVRLQDGMVIAVSLAACGHADAAVEVVGRLVARHGRGNYQAQLAADLAPYMPSLALSLTNHRDVPQILRVALLLRTGEREYAAKLLQDALATTPQVSNPELHLLATNAIGGSPEEELARINAYLHRFALSPVALRDRDRPPCAANLKLADAAPSVRGPLVSVLMTAHNTADRIGAAIESLLAQTWQDLEVIVVDDASTDGTAEVVRSLAEADTRVKYVRLPCNAGTYVAKTVGLTHAAGDFITCLDSDDWAHPLRLERQMRPLLKSRRLVATTSLWVRMEDDGTFYARPVYPLTRLNPASPLFRRGEVERHAGLWDAVRTGADSEFLARLRLVFGGKALHRVGQPLTLGAHRANSLMTAVDTGYCPQGMSPTRLGYWEAWTRWHIAELRAGRKPVMPPMLLTTDQGRPFGVSDNMTVLKDDIIRCLKPEAKVGAASKSRSPFGDTDL